VERTLSWERAEKKRGGKKKHKREKGGKPDYGNKKSKKTISGRYFLGRNGKRLPRPVTGKDVEEGGGKTEGTAEGGDGSLSQRGK